MKKVNWVIDKDMFEDYEDKLVKSIRESGGEVHFYDDQRNTDVQKFLLDRFTMNDIVIFHGSLQHGRRVAKTNFYPGIYLTLENYECYKYYGFFGEYLLNSNYMMMGLNDVLRNKNRIFGRFGTDSIFIRPSNGYKSFPGQLLSCANFAQEFDIMTKSYGGLDMDILCVVSPSVDIEEEYRFIVVDGKVVSGSLYMDRNNRKSWSAYYDRLCKDKKAMKFAEDMTKIYQPDKTYTIDICKLSSDEYKLIELNSFCCGSMYGNDYDAVVKEVNECCLDDFNDVFFNGTSN